MNISPDGFTVRFKTEREDLFSFEKSGAKSNTVRIIDHYERQQLKKKYPEKIIIQHEQEIFLRTVTHVYVSEMILGKYIAIFSWTNLKHHHSIRDDTGLDHKAHSMSPDESPILLPKTLIQDLGRHLRGRSHAELISDLLDDYKLYKREGTKHD